MAFKKDVWSGSGERSEHTVLMEIKPSKSVGPTKYTEHYSYISVTLLGGMFLPLAQVPLSPSTRDGRYRIIENLREILTT